MAVYERPFWTSFPARIFLSVLVLGALAVFMIPATRNDAVDPETNNNRLNIEPEADDSACTRDLERILNGMQPGRLGINTDPADLAVELNRWVVKCGSEIQAGLTQDAATQQQLFNEELSLRLQEKRFLPEDIRHVCTSLLARRISASIGESHSSDTQRAVAIFEFVVRNLALWEAQTIGIDIPPATPYENLLWGFGTAEDRAWTVATLLRQLRLDTMILTPQKKPSEWLIGVHVPQVGILLFDPRLGLPIPGPQDAATSPFPDSPATLSDVQQTDSLLRQFDLPSVPYPLQSEDFKDLKVGLIGTPSLWSTRTAELQFMLAPLTAVELYDGVGENALRPGAAQYQRLIEAGATGELWQVQQIEIWNYPLQQLVAFAQSRSDGQSVLNTWMGIFAGPQLLKIDPESKRAIIDPQTNSPVFGAADTTLHAVRIEQLLGNQDEALRHFGPILTSFRTNPSPFNEEAASFAALWIGISQLESKRFSAAESTFERFSTTVRQSSTQQIPVELLRNSAYEWKALVQLNAGSLAGAIQSLKALPADSPAPRTTYLIKRWEALMHSRESQQ